MGTPWKVGERLTVRLRNADDEWANTTIELLPELTLLLSEEWHRLPEENAASSLDDALSIIRSKYPDAYIEWPALSELEGHLQSSPAERKGTISVRIFANAADWLRDQTLMPGEGRLGSRDVGGLDWHFRVIDPPSN